MWSGCGRFFYSTTSEPAKILRWDIHYGHKDVSNVNFDGDVQNVFSSKSKTYSSSFIILQINFPQSDWLRGRIYETVYTVSKLLLKAPRQSQ